MDYNPSREIFPGTYAPCRSPWVDVSGQLIPGWLVLIIVIISIIIILVAEYRAHDCVPNKTCTHSVPKPTHHDSNIEYIDKLIDMVRNNYDYVAWRQALLVGLIVPLPVIYYLKGRLPTFIEWLIVGIFVFFIVYLASSWIWAHFFHPNGRAIEENLHELKNRFFPKHKFSRRDDERINLENIEL